jgi:hypothetical protein
MTTKTTETLREAERRLRGEGHSRSTAAKLAADLIQKRKDDIAMSYQKAQEQIELLKNSRDRIFNNAKSKRGYMNDTERSLYDEHEKEIRKLELELPQEPLSRPGSHLAGGQRAITGHSVTPYKSFGDQLLAVGKPGLLRAGWIQGFMRSGPQRPVSMKQLQAKDLSSSSRISRRNSS